VVSLCVIYCDIIIAVLGQKDTHIGSIKVLNKRQCYFYKKTYQKGPVFERTTGIWVGARV
jgi:hypothetical protein